MDRSTRAKIESLLYELRSWEPAEARANAQELARRFHLDPLVVSRIAETEGVQLDLEETLDEMPASPTESTLVMSAEEIIEGIDEPA